MPKIDDAIEALLDYQQADMEGVMVLASRQAIHEVCDALRRSSERTDEATSYHKFWIEERDKRIRAEFEVRTLRIDNARLRDEAAIRASVSSPVTEKTDG